MEGGGPEAGAYIVEASVTGDDSVPNLRRNSVTITLKASAILWLYIVREDGDGATLVYPLPSQRASNPLEAVRSHRIPLVGSARMREPAETPRLLLIGSPAPLADFDAALVRWRVPEGATGVPLSGPPLTALRSALGLPRLQGGPPRLFAKADRLPGHPEMVRGLWVRRIGD